MRKRKEIQEMLRLSATMTVLAQHIHLFVRLRPHVIVIDGKS